MGPLRDRMSEDLLLSGFSACTKRIYLYYCEKFTKYFNQSPEKLGEKEVRTFLLYLLQERKLGHTSYRQCYAALKFLYSVTLKRSFEVETIPRHRKIYKLPNVLSGTEVEALFASFTSLKYRTAAMTIYAAGLRISEACHLAVQDIDSKRMLIHVRQGKGFKDRFVMLSERLLEALRYWWKVARPAHYLFEGREGMGHPMSDASFRSALKKARTKAGITKRVNAHLLRHSFATHLMELGVDVAVIQALLGHRYLRSTTYYVHISNRRIQNVVSPLDFLGTYKGSVLG